MAFIKTLTLPSGASGNYTRLITYRWDRTTKEALALFALYSSKDFAAQGKPPFTQFIAKLRLERAKFDQYLSNDALTNADVLAQLYLAAKTEPVISDFGSDVFSDAQEG
jgi:hypothetical protein